MVFPSTKHRGRFLAFASSLGLAMYVAACARPDARDAVPDQPVSIGTADSAAGLPFGQGGAIFASTVTAAVGGKPWTPPAESDIPSDSLGASIRRGLALVRHLTDSLPTYVSGQINCTNCHLQDGRSRYGSPLVGAYVRYPKYIARSAAVVTMADRINFCITRSLAGERLPTDSREMTDMIVYLAWLSRGLPQGAQTPGSDGLPTLKAAAVPDPAHGAQVYAAKCQSCHQADGAGVRSAASPASSAVSASATGSDTSGASVPTSIPALWGAASYSVGASMARVERAASFVAHNMPYGQPGTLSTQDAFDVAAYINSQPRPDLPSKENDWPAGGAPADLPYTTSSGHLAVNPPPLLPRRVPARTLVPPPPKAAQPKAPLSKAAMLDADKTQSGTPPVNTLRGGAGVLTAKPGMSSRTREKS